MATVFYDRIKPKMWYVAKVDPQGNLGAGFDPQRPVYIKVDTNNVNPLPHYIVFNGVGTVRSLPLSDLVQSVILEPGPFEGVPRTASNQKDIEASYQAELFF